MPEDSGSARRGPFPALPALALMLIVSAVVLQVPALKSSRPLHDPLPELGKGFGERVRARLWQDPLQAVYAEHEKRKKERRKVDLAEIKDELGAINDSLAKSTATGETEPDWRLNLKINRGTKNGTADPEFGGDDSEDRKTDQAADPKTPSPGDFWQHSRVAQRVLFAKIPSLFVRSVGESLDAPSFRKGWEKFKILAGAAKKTAKTEAAASVGGVLDETTGEEVGYRGLLLVAVLLHGGPYPEDAENRMRTRYAVLSALGEAGYKPKTSEHITYVDLETLQDRRVGECEKEALYHEKDRNTGRGERRKRSFLIPFERFDYSKIAPERAGKSTPVYVVWIDEDALNDPENVVYDLDRDEFAWRLSRTLAKLQEWLNCAIREEIVSKFTPEKISRLIEKATPRALDGIRPSFSDNEWTLLRPNFESDLQQDITDWIEDLKEDPDRYPLKPTEYRVIGPVSSESWLAMRRARLQNPPPLPDDEPPFPHLQVYCPWATVADQIFDVMEDARSQPVEHGPPEKPPHFSLCRTTANDADLFRSLLRELELRDASPFRNLTSGQHAGIEDRSEYFNPEKHMVLLGEWDTLYGRARRCTILNVALPGSDEHYFCKEDKGPIPPPWDNALFDAYIDPERNLHFISYLRGLDGRLPDEQNAEKASTRDAEMEGLDLQGELPVGRAQLDYLRRLQQVMRKLKAERSAAGEELKAIGVIGSDVYDKLLILRALRPHFPRAVFFTTDLDAHMAHPSEYEHTRNLIVASPYGLTLHETLQRGTPPFRDSYQTAMYLTTLYALGDKEATKRLGESFDVPDPRVYEIGRSGAYDLGKSELDQEKAIHPTSERDLDLAWWRSRLWIIIGVLVCVVILVIPLFKEAWFSVLDWASGDVKGDLNDLKEFVVRKRWRRWTVYVLVGAGLGGIVHLVFSHVGSGEDIEPLALFEGISAWPTELVRLVVCLFSFFFLIQIARGLSKSRRKIEKAYLLSADRPRTGLSHGVTAMWQIMTLQMDECEPEKIIHIETIWANYKWIGKPAFRAMRTVFFALIFILFGFMLMSMLGFPNKPIRGSMCLAVDRVLLPASVFLMMLLVFYVVDATRMCNAFISMLCKSEVGWENASGSIRNGKVVSHDISDANRDNLRKIRLISEYTESVGKCFKFPFIVLCLMMLSRQTVFDNWDLPVSLLLVFGLAFVPVLYCGWLLRRSALRMRQVALNMVRQERDEFLRGPTDVHISDPRVKGFKYVIDEINAIRTGAFSSVAESPILGAPLIPVGLYGLTELLATLSR